MPMSLFGKPRYTMVKVARKREIPSGLWTKCEECGEIIYNKALEENLKVCPKCQYHFSLSAPERIQQLLDPGTFKELDADLRSVDPLGFKGPKTYKEKLRLDQAATGLSEAAVTGEGRINGARLVFGVTDSRFIMGSMGSVVGEKIARAVERALRAKLPLVIVSGSGGGARMYEGMFSLMQMSKTSAALAQFHEHRLPFISVLTDPTMAGVMASYASLGDLVVAEPRALIGFTGPRVIEQTIRQRLPAGFQRSEFLLDHGMIDLILHRKQLKSTLAELLEYLTP
ncbi:MAG: acetyl-CoA carboxylase subunit beta [Omnitrophica WOR_2 bacterium RIFCSPHIGHO2_02_FULL_68_15]|nr:MAG: acetyl-CoA carboxylase subunit beta [Omnitrophica WOR_2 bacterium RIFCSPHIGHO2_02_FULL_68_15]